jgi:hypothetical protein
MDIDSGYISVPKMLDVSPCLLKSRPFGYYITNRFRRMTIEEMCRLQGVEPSSIISVGSRRQMGERLGNAMSKCVLDRLFVRLLPSIKGIQSGHLADQWE